MPRVHASGDSLREESENVSRVRDMRKPILFCSVTCLIVLAPALGQHETRYSNQKSRRINQNFPNRMKEPIQQQQRSKNSAYKTDRARNIQSKSVKRQIET